MIENIVLAIDGSTPAKHAQAVAIDLASKYKAQLTIVHVLTHDHPPTEFARMAEVEDLLESKQANSGDNKDTYSLVANFVSGGKEGNQARVIAALGDQIVSNAAKNAGKAGVTKVAQEVRLGDYANSILEVADQANADIIVMGRRGLSNLKGFVTGSVSHKVSQRAECSVLTVK